MHWVTLFDIEQSGFKDWWPLCFGIVFLAAMIFLVLAPNEFYRRLLGRLRADAKFGFNPSRRVFGLVGLLVVAAFMVSSISAMYSNYGELRRAREDGAFRIIEGRVDHYQCCKSVSFDVGGVVFKYTSDVLTSAFNDDGGLFDPGGPVKAGMYVRIAYIDRPGSGDFYAREILRVEVRK